MSLLLKIEILGKKLAFCQLVSHVWECLVFPILCGKYITLMFSTPFAKLNGKTLYGNGAMGRNIFFTYLCFILIIE